MPPVAGHLRKGQAVKWRAGRCLSIAVMTDQQLDLKPKDLMMMPARAAMALQADGWWLRSEIVWHKPNPMPESVTDRPTNSHEKVFLLSKSGAALFWSHPTMGSQRTKPEPDYRWAQSAHRGCDGSRAGRVAGYGIHGPEGRRTKAAVGADEPVGWKRLLLRCRGGEDAGEAGTQRFWNTTKRARPPRSQGVRTADI